MDRFISSSFNELVTRCQRDFVIQLCAQEKKRIADSINVEKKRISANRMRDSSRQRSFTPYGFGKKSFNKEWNSIQPVLWNKPDKNKTLSWVP